MAAYAAYGAAPSQAQRTLWVGDLEEWMNEQWMWQVFTYGQTVTDCKVIRNRATGQCSGYGFVEFSNSYEAEQVLNGWNGKPIPNHPAGKMFKLNWAQHGLSKQALQAQGGGDFVEFAVFVGDLAHEVTDMMLMSAFAHYPSVKSAKVVVDSVTGVAKGFGFVRFASEEEKNRAITEMNGAWLGARQIRCSEAEKKGQKPGGVGQDGQPGDGGGEQGGAGSDRIQVTEQEAEQDQANTTLFVGGLDASITDGMLHQAFSGFGHVIYCRCPPGKSCGFVQFDTREAAQAALDGMQGQMVGRCRLRVQWGKAGVGKGNQPLARQPPSQSWGGGYGGWGQYAYSAGEQGAGVQVVEPEVIIDAPQDAAACNALYITSRESRFACRFLGRSENGIDRLHSFEPT